MKYLTRFGKALVFLTILTAPYLLAEEPQKQESTTKEAATLANPRPPFAISKETTYLTEPLRSDGYVDYVAALNTICSKGVTPENNAVVLMLEATGPEKISENIRSRYFQMLGTEPLPEMGDYLIYFCDYRKQVDGKSGRAAATEDGANEPKEMDQFWKVMDGPWSAEKYPVYAEWLKANRKPLEKIREAARRTKFYSPILADGEYQLLSCCYSLEIEIMESSRTCARFLMEDAMFSIGEGKIAEAQQDILACHRLGRLVGQGPMLVDVLDALAIDGMACSGDLTLAQSGTMNAAQVANFQRELHQLPPLPKMADKIDVAERFSFLDCVAMSAQQGPGSVNNLFVVPEQKPSKMLMLQLSSISTAEFDWDTVLRIGNSWYDRMAEASRKPTCAKCAEAWQRIDDDFKVMKEKIKSEKSVKRSLKPDELLRTAIAKKMGDVLICGVTYAEKDAHHAEERHQVDNDFSQLVLALEAYRIKQKAYPARLADLAPKYIPKLPRDRFSDTDYIYRPEGSGYILYSVGRNGKDDGGKSTNNDPPDPDGDDIVIRMPSTAK